VINIFKHKRKLDDLSKEILEIQTKNQKSNDLVKLHRGEVIYDCQDKQKIFDKVVSKSSPSVFSLPLEKEQYVIDTISDINNRLRK